MMAENETGTSDAPAALSQGFEGQGLSSDVLAGIEALGYREMTPVQKAVISTILEGRDVLVQSKTGTGKTAAFGIPIVERVSAGRGLQALILTPTRELCAQVANELGALARKKGVRVLAIYGGVSLDRQAQELAAGCEVVVATPGRWLDHLRRGSARTDAVRIRVLDEADEMLSMGFWEDVTAILDQLKAVEQTLLFSATLPPAIEGLASRHLRTPLRIDLSREVLTVDAIEHIIYYVEPEMTRARNFLRVLEAERPVAAIMFCNTRDDVQLVGNFLGNAGISVEAISGELTQREREVVMAKVKAGTAKLLVATDVASRGIDIADLSHVFNYAFPEDPEVYLHRVGRTGRIGKRGIAVSLLDGRELVAMREIRKRYGVRFVERRLPSAAEIAQREERRVLSELAAQAAAEDVAAFDALAKRVLENHEATHIVAYLLKRAFAPVVVRPALTREEPKPVAAPVRPVAPAPVAAPLASPVASISVPAPGAASAAVGSTSAPGDRGGDRESPRRETPRRDERPRDAGYGESRQRDDGERGPSSPGAHDRMRVHLNIGRESGIDEDGLRRLVATVAQVSPAEVHAIEIMDRFSFVEVMADAGETLCERAPGRRFGDVELRAEPARERGSSGGARRRRPRSDR